MPIMRIKEMREMSTEERSKKLGELKTDLVRLKTMIRAGGTIENPARVKQLRKTIARLITIENEEQLGLFKKQKKKPEPKKKVRKVEKKR